MALKNFSLPEFLNTNETPLCSTTDPEIFFPQDVEFNGRTTASPKYHNLAAAKELCSKCPLQIQCLEYAIRNSEMGIWGGTTESQREGLRRSRRIRVNKRAPSPKIW
jgi:WhiB family redox-sensing transcriptional regulator